MKFIPCNTGITSTVEVTDKPVHQIKKIVLMQIVVLSVQPVDFITSVEFIMVYDSFVAQSGRLQLVSIV